MIVLLGLIVLGAILAALFLARLNEKVDRRHKENVRHLVMSKLPPHLWPENWK